MSDSLDQSNPQGGKRILIVEDDPIVARIYENRLVKAGFTVSVAVEGLRGERYVLGSEIGILDAAADEVGAASPGESGTPPASGG